MKFTRCTLCVVTLVAVSVGKGVFGDPLTAGFTYQGRLAQNGQPVNGNVNLAFFLYNASSSGTQIGSSIALTNQSVVDGLFTVVLNASGQFGANAFSGERRWLEIWVNGGPLSPRQELTATPNAFFALNALTAPWSGLTGVPAVALLSIPQTFTAMQTFSGGVSTNSFQLSSSPHSSYVLTSDGSGIGTWQSLPSGSLAWQTNGSSIYYLNGNVGIGINPPVATLHVAEGNSGIGIRLPGLRVEQNITSFNVIGGYSGNIVATGVYGATIWGGGDNYPNSGSLFPNKVFDRYCTVSGGIDNWAGLDDSQPEASGYATIAGGASNRASGVNSTISGGYGNSATGQYATVSGGSSNVASGNLSTVAGGAGNAAAGAASFAAGRRAKANNTGSFVWADDSNTFNDVTSSADNQWTARCAGGVRFFADQSMLTGVILNSGSGSWSSASDRNLKENLVPVNSRKVLDRLASLPIQTWNYKSQEAEVRHMGPTAQDFRAAFELGEDERHISAVDADGVGLAAIQGLYQIVKTQQAEIAELKNRLKQLEQRSSHDDPFTGQ